MMRLKQLIIGFSLFSVLYNLNGQNKNYVSMTSKGDTLVKDFRVYGGLIHQHQDFFNKAFSFQGIEAGVIVNHSLLAGAYCSMFVSNLDIKHSTYPNLFVNIGQGGLFAGYINNANKVIHTGWLLNIGYFLLTGDETNFALFQITNPKVNINGLVLTPQVFAEMNITRWMKLRTGLSYSYYSFENQSIIMKSDLNNISLTFGFIFGKFN